MNKDWSFPSFCWLEFPDCIANSSPRWGLILGFRYEDLTDIPKAIRCVVFNPLINKSKLRYYIGRICCLEYHDFGRDVFFLACRLIGWNNIGWSSDILYRSGHLPEILGSGWLYSVMTQRCGVLGQAQGDLVWLLYDLLGLLRHFICIVFDN